MKYKGWATIDQIRTISKERILSLNGFINDLEIEVVKRIFRETFVD